MLANERMNEIMHEPNDSVLGLRTLGHVEPHKSSIASLTGEVDSRKHLSPSQTVPLNLPGAVSSRVQLTFGACPGGWLAFCSLGPLPQHASNHAASPNLRTAPQPRSPQPPGAVWTTKALPAVQPGCAVVAFKEDPRAPQDGRSQAAGIRDQQLQQQPSSIPLTRVAAGEAGAIPPSDLDASHITAGPPPAAHHVQPPPHAPPTSLLSGAGSPRCCMAFVLRMACYCWTRQAGRAYATGCCWQ